ncbi:MAG: TPM domain-containing protein [Verrucomicrobiota bacterium]
MRLFVWLRLCLALGVLHAPLYAQGEELWERLPKPDRPVADFADLISPADEQRLEALLRETFARTETPIVVATVPSLEGGQIDDFTVRLYERWGIGTQGNRIKIERQ